VWGQSIQKGRGPPRSPSVTVTSASSWASATTFSCPKMDAHEDLLCDLRGYQKQALKWMFDLEEGEGGRGQLSGELAHAAPLLGELPHPSQVRYP